MPLSIAGMAGVIADATFEKPPFWIHSPTWKDIILRPLPKAPLAAWVPITVAFALFALLGSTSRATESYRDAFKWIRRQTLERFEVSLKFMRRFFEIFNLRATWSNQNGDPQNAEYNL